MLTVTDLRASIQKHLSQTTESAPLAVFRVLFGLMIFASIVRFWGKGWIQKLYIDPQFFFSYYGFESIKPLGEYTYIIFVICGLAALLVALGYHYRLAIITLFLSFTYIELMDKTTYLNHYYFISLISFILIFLPANAYFSVDAKSNPKKAYQKVPVWTSDVVKIMLGIVYFYAGLAKLNSDWLLHAMPLKIWLPSSYDLPWVGRLLQQEWLHYSFSWTGVIYDLSIPFILLNKRTRLFGFVMVVFFHVITSILFPIGMFPYIMIVSSLIFFDSRLHHKILDYVASIFRIAKEQFDNGKQLVYKNSLGHKLKKNMFIAFFAAQLLLPLRYVLYPGELFWTEEGFRFSWRVMLMEKTGYANFKVVNAKNGQRFYVDNRLFLSSFQEKQMSTQPDFILEYAHFLEAHYAKQIGNDVEVYVESYVALNGRLSRPYIDPKRDLTIETDSFNYKNWILPFDDEIKGI